MTVDEIRELIALATESGIAELEVQRGDNRVRIRRASFAAPQEIVVAAPSYAAPAPPPHLAQPPRRSQPRTLPSKRPGARSRTIPTWSW